MALHPLDTIQRNLLLTARVCDFLSVFMLWWSFWRLFKVLVVSTYSSKESDQNCTSVIVDSMESETLIVSSACSTVATGPPEQKLVEPVVTTKKVKSTMALSSTNDAELNHRRRPNLDNVVDDDNSNYYIHPNAGYVSRTNNSIVNYKCQWQNYRGSIVAGSKAILFQGSFFLFDKTFVLSWDNIRQVVLIDPVTSTSGLNGGRSNSNNNNNNSGIEIIMSDETVHSFMMNQQQQNFGTTATTTTKVWLSLLSLHNDALLGRQQADGQTKTATTSGTQADDNVDSKTTAVTTPRSYERRNSDPVKSSTLIMNPEVFLEDDDHDGASLPPVRCTTTILSTMTELIPIDIIMVHAGSPLRLQPIHCTYAAGGSQSSNSDSSGTESTLLLSITDGRLYIGNDAIIFIGTKKPQKRHYFASTWEHLIVTLPWTTILRIQQQKLDQEANRADSCSNNTPNQIGIRIRTHGDAIIDGAAVEENVFEFTGIETPEQVWASLVAIHNEKLLQLSSIVAVSPKQKPPVGVSILSGSKTTAGHREAGSLSNRRKSHRRTNSDPMMASIQLNFDNYQVLQDENKDDDNRETQSSNDETSTSATTGIEMKQPIITTDGTSHIDLWLSMKNQSTTKEYTDVVIENEMIENCTLEQFYDTFMNIDAIYSMERFLTGRGDFDVRTSDWEEDINAAGSAEPSNVGAWKQYKRVIKYMHPVNVPLAPPQAAARKEQLLTRYHNAGICIVTQTFVDDVPMTDCFYVADRMLVEPSSSIEGGITIRMEFGITFVKSTMFKGIISRKTTAEFIELFKALAQFISNAMISTNIAPLTQDVDMTTTIPINEEVESNVMKFQPSDEMNKNTSKTFLSIDRMILILLVIIQFWIIMELKGMKHAIVSLEQQMRNKNIIPMARGFVDQQNMINSEESLVGR